MCTERTCYLNIWCEKYCHQAKLIGDDRGTSFLFYSAERLSKAVIVF